MKNNSFWVVTTVYGPLEDDDQLLLQQMLTCCKQSNNPSHVVGDFNVVSGPHEGSNWGRDNSAMPDFNQWVEYAELTDYQLSNQIFTWSIAISSSKLDRILIDELQESRL